MQLVQLDPTKRHESISIEGRQYEVRDGVVDVFKEHERGARALGYGHPSEPRKVVEVGAPLSDGERAELEALRRENASAKTAFADLSAKVDALMARAQAAPAAPSTPVPPGPAAPDADAGKAKASK